MVRRGSQMVRHGSVMVRRGSVMCAVSQLWCGVAQIWCGVAQLVAHRLAVRQARVRSQLSTTERFVLLSLQAMRRWREAPANDDG
jgi:hypothetical protein